MMSEKRRSQLMVGVITPGVAWLVLTFALAAHVADEAAHDFLATYNPIVRLRFIPFPTFTFECG